MNLLQTGAKTWTTKIPLKLPHLMIQTDQEHSMQYRHWKQDDYKMKITMFHSNVSDYRTNSWQKLMTQGRTTSTTTCLTWTQTWSNAHSREQHLNTCECPLFVRLQCLFSVVLVWFLAHHTVAQDSRLCLIHHVSCTRWLTLSSTSPSTSLSFSSSSSASSTSFCSSPSLRLSRQHPCALPLRSRIPGLHVLLHRVWAQRFLPHRDLCRVQSGVRNRATVPRRLGLRRRRYRSDALQRVPKTSRSLSRRRPVVRSVVVVNESW